MPTVIRVTIYDSVIAALFLPGGQSWAKMEEIGRHHIQLAIAESPSRTNNLRRSHNLALTPVGKNRCRYSVGNYADYAVYVHEGTTGPIVARGWDDGGASFMFIRPFPHSRFPTGARARSVSGQTANPWITRAGSMALARYGFAAPPARW